MIVLFLDLLQKYSRAKLVALFVILALAVIPNQLFLQMWRNISGINFDGGAPYILNVTMGLQPEEMGNGRLGGWYNGYNYDTFELNGYNIDESKKVAYNDLKALIDHWKSSPSKAREFFFDKIKSTWCDPLFQSLWSGPLEDSDQFVDDKILHSLYTGGHVAIVFEKYMNLFMIAIYLLSGIWCFIRLFRRKAGHVELFYLLLFIGGFISTSFLRQRVNMSTCTRIVLFPMPQASFLKTGWESPEINR